MTVTFAGKSFDCLRAVKTNTSVVLYLESGSTVQFFGVNDFSAFAFEEGGGWEEKPLHEIKSDKEAELSAACNAAITAGMDVKTSQGTEHFELTEVDQINLTTALGAVDAGASGHPYHSTRSLCRMFSADEIRAVSAAAVAHVLYHRTLCNHLLTWVRRAETAEEVGGIAYTAEGLPEDLAANMARVLGTDGGGADV